MHGASFLGNGILFPPYLGAGGVLQSIEMAEAENLLLILRGTPGTRSALSLSRQLGTSKAQVNRALYSLLRTARVSMHASGDGPPLWGLGPLAREGHSDPARTSSSEPLLIAGNPAMRLLVPPGSTGEPHQPQDEAATLQQRRECLAFEASTRSKGSLAPTAVAKALGIDKSLANDALYGLEKRGLVIREQLSPPLWKLTPARGLPVGGQVGLLL